LGVSNKNGEIKTKGGVIFFENIKHKGHKVHEVVIRQFRTHFLFVTFVYFVFEENTPRF